MCNAAALARGLESLNLQDLTKGHPLLLYYVFPWSLGSEDTFSFTFICIRGVISSSTFAEERETSRKVMTFNITGPGKTAPKLYQDFLIFDPVKGVPNVLEQFSPPHGDGPQLAPPIGACRHEYVTKASQSVPPPLDLRDDGSTVYKIAAVCKKCRIHTEVHVDHSNASNPCPASDHPLHHFQRAKAYDNKSEERIQFAWLCSVAECRATLCIVYRKSRWDEEDIQLLSNPERLKR